MRTVSSLIALRSSVMPSFYAQTLQSQLPLTPPDSGSGSYTYRSMQYPQDYMSQQSIGQPRHDSAYDYPQSYLQPAVAPAPPAYQFQQGGYQTAPSLPPIHYPYEPIGAPILPPLRMQDRAPIDDSYQQRLQEQQRSQAAQQQQQQQRLAPKEEKATGGVSAKLDYDMERMTDFVSEAAQSVYALHLSAICLADIDVTRSIQQSMPIQPSFRKWVHQVLCATRLPSATILLSLHYLNDRIANFPSSIVPADHQVHRLLAVALILGSKFLDDNTFINRSWSDVTGIKVTELNSLEMKWLGLINYHLHIDPKAPNGLQCWLDAWKDYDFKATAKLQDATRLSPLNTNVQRTSSSNSARYSPYPTPASRTLYYNNMSASSDPWGPTERNTLEDFYKRQGRYPTLDEIDMVNRARATEQASYYTQPSYASPWNAWGSYRYDYRPYPTQTVMG